MTQASRNKARRGAHTYCSLPLTPLATKTLIWATTKKSLAECERMCKHPITYASAASSEENLGVSVKGRGCCLSLSVRKLQWYPISISPLRSSFHISNPGELSIPRPGSGFDLFLTKHETQRPDPHRLNEDIVIRKARKPGRVSLTYLTAEVRQTGSIYSTSNCMLPPAVVHGRMADAERPQRVASR